MKKNSKKSYKVVCNDRNADFISHDYDAARDIFNEYREKYGDGIRLYESLNDGEEWDLIDYFDEEEPEQPLPTQGEWYAREGSGGQWMICAQLNGNTIAVIYNHEPAKANAELICQAVNERQQLIDALEEITEMALKWSVKGLTPTIHKAQRTISNAKNYSYAKS